MTKDQIKAELRRLACYDNDPIFNCSDAAYAATYKFREDDELLMTINEARTFFLLVAEAL